MVENLLDLLGFELDFARFVYNLRQVGWLRFWRRKPATRPTGIGPWAWKPEIDRRERRFELKSNRDRMGWSVWQVAIESGHP